VQLQVLKSIFELLTDARVEAVLVLDFEQGRRLRGDREDRPLKKLGGGDGSALSPNI